MYYAIKTIEISAAHRLNLTYESPCQEVHGHNWKIKVFCQSLQLNENGMVEDFAKIKKMIHGALDHTYLNENPYLRGINPTAENIARWIVDSIPTCYRAEVQESENNLAIYEV